MREQTGPTITTNVKEHIAAKKQSATESSGQHPYSGKTVPRATLYPATTTQDIAAWLKELSNRKELRPTQKQMEFLKALCERIKTEAQEESTTTVRSAVREPMFDMIHGVPGCGKSQLIAWTQELFVNVLHWEHGVQFVCIAFQNAMAAHIDGFTIHHWTGIPVGEHSQTTASLHKFANKCMHVRFVLIDEISMVSAKLFSAIEVLMRKVLRSSEELGGAGHVARY